MVSDTRIRLDKWLCRARFFKNRVLAAGEIQSGHVRINGEHVQKSARLVGPQDVLTLVHRGAVRVVRIEAIGTRRGPAAEAQALYRDLAETPSRDGIRAPSDEACHGEPNGDANPNDPIAARERLNE